MKLKGHSNVITKKTNGLYECKTIKDGTVPIERFRQAGIAAINKLYGK